MVVACVVTKAAVSGRLQLSFVFFFTLLFFSSFLYYQECPLHTSAYLAHQPSRRFSRPTSSTKSSHDYLCLSFSGFHGTDICFIFCHILFQDELCY